MRRASFFSIGVALLAMVMSACSSSENPTTSSNIDATGGASENPGILARLHNPTLTIAPIDQVRYQLIFSAGASGTSDSEPMVAVRTIREVEFEIHAPNGSLIDTRVAREIVTTGVMGDESVASLTVIADSEWQRNVRIQEGTYAIANVRGRNGELL